MSEFIGTGETMSKSNDSNYYVVVIRDSDESLVRKMGPMSHKKAERVEGAMVQKVDYSRYGTDVVTSARLAELEAADDAASEET